MPNLESQQALEWRSGNVPVATRFDDPYFSLDNGLAETRHVFLEGNDLPARFCDGFHIAELGFGTGLNFLSTWAAWRAAGVKGRFYFTSFEAYPIRALDMKKALEAFPDLSPLAQHLIETWAQGRFEMDFGDAHLNIIPGDARETLPRWPGDADAWFLDGFSPVKNPELWEADLMCAVAQHTRPRGTIATYTAAGHVRRALETAGFRVTRCPGFGRKRHMTKAALR